MIIEIPSLAEWAVVKVLTADGALEDDGHSRAGQLHIDCRMPEFPIQGVHRSEGRREKDLAADWRRVPAKSVSSGKRFRNGERDGPRHLLNIINAVHKTSEHAIVLNKINARAHERSAPKNAPLGLILQFLQAGDGNAFIVQ